ncbi:MAG: helix-hairpin-helix domain-containing protein, partial [Vulcanimicrobiaceae bacterium]
MNLPPSNAEIARKLREIRTLMEFAGEPFFKFTAYERAAETVENAPPLAELAAAGRLAELPGIGGSLAAKIAELVASGRSALYEELTARFPPSLLGVLEIPGIGIKTARALFEERGIASVDALARALEQGELAGVARLGPKSLANLARSVR